MASIVAMVGISHSSRADSRIIVWGANTYGETNVPPGLTNTVVIASGGFHIMALKRDGTVIAWGENLAGQTNVPPGLTNVTGVGTGYEFSLALKNDGTVVAWGKNNFGQTNVPAGLTNVVAVAGGSFHALALKADGTVVAWGYNYYGQTNVPAGLTNVIAIAASSDSSAALTGDGRIVQWGFPVNSLAGLTNVIMLAGGESASGGYFLALKADGSVASSSAGSPGNPPTLTNATEIAGASQEALAILSDGKLVSWGPLTPPLGLSNVDEVACGEYDSLALIGDGQPYFTSSFVDRTIVAGQTAWLRARATGAWPISYQWLYSGTNLPGATNAVLTLSNVTPADAGSYSVVTSNVFGEVVSPTFNVLVAPALITVQPKSQTVLLGTPATFSVNAIGSPQLNYQWQFDGTNLLGATDNTLLLTNVQLNQAGMYSVVISSIYGSVTSIGAQLNLTQIAVWGDNSFGQKNLLPGLTNVVAIAAGSYYSLGLRADGTVFAWGDNAGGAINVPAGLSNVVAVAAGQYHSLALRADGTVVGWGYNNSGQATPPPGLSNVVAIAAGDSHSAVLRADGTVVAWGDNSEGQTNVPAGLSNVVAIAAGGYNNLAVTGDGHVVAWGSYGQTAVPDGLGEVVAVAAGENYNMALKGDGTIVAWASGPSTLQISNVLMVSARGNNNEALLSDGSVVAWGSNTYGQTNVPPGLPPAAAIAQGFQHTLALIGDGAPFLTSPLFNRSVDFYSTVYLKATATGAGPLTYQWQFYGTNLPGATNATLLLSNMTPAVAGSYSVVISNALGITQAPPFSVSAVPTTGIEPATQVTYVGSTVSIHTTATASPLTYQWQFNGVDLPGATDSVLVLTNLQLSQAGPYSVAVNSPAGLAKSANATIFVTQIAVWGADSESSVPADLTNVLAVAGGVVHTLALKGDGTVVGWAFGNYAANDYGQASPPPGLSNVIGIAAGEYHSLALRADGTVVGWGFGNSGQTTAPPDLTNAVAIAAGVDHSLAVRTDGSIAVWGGGAYGQTSPPPGLTNVVAIAAAGYLSLALTKEGNVVAWGGITQPLVPTQVKNAVAIGAGGDHGLALLADGTVVDWNLDGTIQTNVPPGLTNVIMIAAGAQNLAVTKDGRVVGWPDPTIPIGLADVTSIAESYYQSMAVVKGLPPPLQVTMTNLTWNQSAFSFSLPTLSGRVYQPEFKTELDDPNWHPLPLWSGNGSTLQIIVPQSIYPQGFYRVRRW